MTVRRRPRRCSGHLVRPEKDHIVAPTGGALKAARRFNTLGSRMDQAEMEGGPPRKRVPRSWPTRAPLGVQRARRRAWMPGAPAAVVHMVPHTSVRGEKRPSWGWTARSLSAGPRVEDQLRTPKQRDRRARIGGLDGGVPHLGGAPPVRHRGNTADESSARRGQEV